MSHAHSEHEEVIVFMSRELETQLAPHYGGAMHKEFMFLDSRNMMLYQFAGRFVNYVHRGIVTMIEGPQTSLEEWKAHSEALRDHLMVAITEFDARKIVEAIVSYLVNLGYRFAMKRAAA